MQIDNIPIQIPTTTNETSRGGAPSQLANGKTADAFSSLLAALMGNMENMEAAELIGNLENLEGEIEGESEEAEVDLAYQMAIPFNLMNFQKQSNEATVEANLDKAELVQAETQAETQTEAQILNLSEDGEEITNFVPKEVIAPKEEAKISFEEKLQTEGKKLGEEKIEGEKLERIPLEDKRDTFKAEMFNQQPEAKEIQNPEPKIEAKQLEQTVARENLQRLNDSIIKLIQTTTVDNKSVMKVKLYPEELGTLDLTLEMQEGKLVAKILVDNESVKQLFSDKLGDLSQNLAKQNINIQDFKVEVKPEASLDFNFQGEFSQENRKNPRTNRIYGHKEIMPEEIPVEVTSRLATSGELSILA